MLIKNIKVSGLLSFGPEGIDLPMRNLNVLIGPNGSGKSNLLEVINLYHETPSPLRSIAGPIMESGGIDEWLWKEGSEGDGEPMSAYLSCVIAGPREGEDYRHFLSFYGAAGALLINQERIEAIKSPDEPQSEARAIYAMTPFGAVLYDIDVEGLKPQRRTLKNDQINSSASILAQVRDPGRYEVFEYLRERYSKIHLHRNWSFGPHASLRKPQRADGRTDGLAHSGRNLAVIVGAMSGRVKKRLLQALQSLYADIHGVHVRPVAGGSLQLYLEEAEGVEIPASRLSDGTLRYLMLLVVLLDPEPPPLIVIEEPELGLHPDVIPPLATLLIEASTKTQIIITTHSRMLVDALGDDPESIVVCTKENGQTQMERLSSEDLGEWLEKYSLGDLWSKGEIGGNRW